MADSKLILPLLEGFLMGDAISDHHGVRCCPAMHAETEEKYIVKTIRVPADAGRLDALLLAGAYPDRAAAVAYFKSLAEDIIQEAKQLKNLAQLDGFDSYDAWQIEPTEDGEAFDVYLLHKYHPTLERYMSRNPMTHLGAVNLGLDLCSALAASRRSGLLYVDLKPGNVFMTADNEYRIGDLGFIPLASLPYAGLPEKYQSAYTPPEISDTLSSLNETLDTYAAGLILYQVYNNGQLPEPGAAGEALPAPEYADYEMAAIILKACHPDPAERWQDPAQMGQALVNYMQTNVVNDEPIVPPALPVESIAEEIPANIDEEEPSTDAIVSAVDQALEAVGVETAEPAAETLDIEEIIEAVEDATDTEEIIEETTEEIVEEIPEEITEETPEEITEETPEEIIEETPEEITEETAEEAPVEFEEISMEEMLAQADDLIAHETPEPVVAPAPIDVPIPPRIVPEDEPEEIAPEIAEEVPAEAIAEEPSAEEPEVIEEEIIEEVIDEDNYEEPAEPRRGKGLIIALISFIAATLLFTAGFLFYKYEYQQTIYSISLVGDEDKLTVSLHSDIADELLTVVCTDAYGNTKRQNVVDGVAVFTGLAPDTRYKVEVQISGFHGLTGKTSGTYVTAEETKIIGLTATAGQETGTVYINFTVQGPESAQWRVYYVSLGEPEQYVTCTGHVAMIDGLTIGKTYTFRVEPMTELYLVGNDTVEYTPVEIVYAENLVISGFVGDKLQVKWDAPVGSSVTSWTVRCINASGYEKTVIVTDTVAEFTEMDRTQSYTIEVLAPGMVQGSQIELTANSVSILNITTDTTDLRKLQLRWEFEGIAPEGGWVVKYTVVGMTDSIYLDVADASAVIMPMIPDCEYTIEILTAGNGQVFGGSFTFTSPEPTTFSGYKVTAQHMTFSMCRTPNKTDWDRGDVPSRDYTTTFTVGQSASFVIRLAHEYNTSPDVITTLFVIRDAEGNLVRFDTQDRTWTSMWYKGYGKATIPTMPETAGDYTVEIYFNGQYVTTQSFQIQ